MENFDIIEIIGKDTLPKIGYSIISKKPLLTVFTNRIVFNKAAEKLFDLSINSKVLIVTGSNGKKYICLNCGEYTVGFALDNSSKQLTFGSGTEMNNIANFYKKPIGKDFSKFSLVIGTETATKSVTDGLTGKTHSLVFHELTLLEAPQAENTRPYTPANFTKNGMGVKQAINKLNHVANEAN